MLKPSRKQFSLEMSMNTLSRIASMLALVALAIVVFVPEWRQIATISAVISTLILWAAREIGHSRNQRLQNRILELGGSLEGLGKSAERNHPNNQTAAAVMGQGDLATMSYEGLVSRMKQDGHIL
ncbi:MAG: hypothetical protein LC634_04170 [Sphingomonadales bacterium]|nr:hypothetical protein [Sphingomonadales bacterium]